MQKRESGETDAIKHASFGFTACSKNVQQAIIVLSIIRDENVASHENLMSHFVQLVKQEALILVSSAATSS